MHDSEFENSYVEHLQGLLAATKASGVVLGQYPAMATEPKLKAMLNSGSEEDNKQLQMFTQMLNDLGVQPGGAANPLTAAAIGIGQLKVVRSAPGAERDASIIETLQATLLVYVAAYRTMANTARRLGKQAHAEQFAKLSEYMQKKDADYEKLAQTLAVA